MKLRLLHLSWPQVWNKGHCQQVNHEEETVEKRQQNCPVDQEEKKGKKPVERKKQDFPVDKQKYKVVIQLLME